MQEMKKIRGESGNRMQFLVRAKKEGISVAISHPEQKFVGSLHTRPGLGCALTQVCLVASVLDTEVQVNKVCNVSKFK